MKTYLTTLIIIAALWCVSNTSEVMESNSPYSCCGNTGIKFDPRCETTWNVNNMPVAMSNGECISPCKEVKEGWIMLDSCIDINATTLCNDGDMIHETRTHYHSIPCSTSALNHAGSQGLDGLLLLLLLLLMGGFFC